MDMVFLLALVVMMGAFVFMNARRQRKLMQAQIDLHDSLQIGDRIHTTAGIEGTITAITDDTVDMEIAPGVVTTWMKQAVRDKIEDDVEEDIEEDIEDDVEDDDEYEDVEDEESTATEITESPNTKTDG
jgi:preprotein translocase subunit YajC